METDFRPKHGLALILPPRMLHRQAKNRKAPQQRHGRENRIYLGLQLAASTPHSLMPSFPPCQFDSKRAQ